MGGQMAMDITHTVIGWKSVLYQNTKHGGELKLPNSTITELFLLLIAFSHWLKLKFRNKWVGKYQQKNQVKVCEYAKRHNLRHENVRRDENLQRENEMDSPSFEGFHAQLDCKLT